MNNFFRFNFKKHIEIIVIILIFFFINILIFNNNKIWWDSAVYIGMGKYIFSLGQSGLWEPSRPLVLPFLLGLIWKLNLNVLFFGKILILFFSIGSIILTYLISLKVFNKKIALLSSFLFAFSSTFIFFSTKIMTGIVSLFFILLAIFFFTEKKFFLAGIFSGLSVMSRFLQLFVVIGLFVLFLIYYRKNKNFLKLFFRLNFGFILVLIPYFILNYFLCHNALYPFFLQSFMSKNTGWMYFEPWFFYFIGLIKENFLFVFSLLGLALVFKEKTFNKLIIANSFLILIVFFTLISHKEMRFVLVFLPFLSVLSSYGFDYLMNKFNKKKIFIYLFFFLLFIGFLQVSYNYSVLYQNSKFSTNTFEKLNSLVDTRQVENEIWITNPLYLIDSDKKAKELMYYPTFNHDKFLELKQKIDGAKLILFNSCDLYCEPYNNYCEEDKKELIKIMKYNFKIDFHEKKNECESYVFFK